MFHSICVHVKLQTVLRYTSGGGTDMRYCKGSTGFEQAGPRSTVVSVQQDVALDDLSVTTLPYISLCGGGGPRYPSLLQGKFSSEGIGLLRYVWYHSPKHQLSLHVAVGSPRRRSAANKQLVHPCRLHTSPSTTACSTPTAGYAELMPLSPFVVPGVAMLSRLVKMITCVGCTSSL